MLGVTRGKGLPCFPREVGGHASRNLLTTGTLTASFQSVKTAWTAFLLWSWTRGILVSNRSRIEEALLSDS